MNRKNKENLNDCIESYNRAVKDVINHPDDEIYAEKESYAFRRLYEAIRQDVLEKHAKKILDELNGILPF